MTHLPILQTDEPSRRCLCDWASTSSKVETQAELEQLLVTAKETVSECIGFRERKRMRSAGNFLEGEAWERFGAEIKWSSQTAADLIGADPVGRCVNHVNVVLRGSTGIGSIPLTQAAGLLSALSAIGFSSARRLDLSVDVFNHPELTVRLVASRLADGSWKIPRRDPRSFNYHGPLVDEDGQKQGATLYIGSKDSDIQVCIYDKGRKEGAPYPWIRIECRYKAERAVEALYRLVQAHDSAMETSDPASSMDRAVVGLIRSAFDIRDVSKYRGTGKLPKNWASDQLTSYPSLMHPVFEETAPIHVGAFKATGVFASRTRHLMRSGGKHMWRLAIILLAKGRDPGDGFLTMGAPSAMTLTDEDFREMSQISGFSIADLETAELKAHTQLLELHGIDAECISSDRTLLREELLRMTGGV